jgi:hypothetical protein
MNIFPKKVCLVPQKEEEPKIHMAATRRNLQAQPKILKKIIETPNIPIRKKKLPKKICFVVRTLKV